eukprot:CAMPEP_0194306472 /NCGR_PEP_ID=MMETSP0171-20130528/3611_1 /TAXON_ID=218684 /ORGANISM="Corethron pennatum, Strain L29A3" /LENGTH=709 /DNA_ID=CAMNT_0039058257 /DNA_START=61 /DNA_END=2190 /DNA_ORIENTATION=-
MWPSSLLIAALAFALVRASAENDTTEARRVLLVGPALPWIYGPYQQQLGFLADGLNARGHTIYWFPAGLRRPTDRSFFGPADAAQTLRAILPDAGDELRFSGVRFVGSEGPDWHMSTINEVARSHEVEAVIVLKDVDAFVPDEPLDVPVSVYWFPNHFQKLDPMTRVRLSSFTHVAALSPSDAKMIATDAKVSELLDVRHIPHAVSLPDDLPPLSSPGSKKELRAHFKVPEDAFVVVVNSGNYERENRKAFDTSVFAFEALRKIVPEAFLYLHVVDSIGIIRSTENVSGNVGLSDSVPLDSMIYHAGIPEDAYIWDNRILSYVEVLQLVQMADVLLQPSKTEGFGMPVLEAQLIGTPAVTTRDGAMGDFTKFGVAVPPLGQPCWLGRGFVAQPDLQGVVDALVEVHGGLSDESRLAAQNWVRKEMSVEAVVDAFEALVSEGLRSRPPKPRISGGEAGPRPTVFDTHSHSGSSSNLLETLSDPGRYLQALSDPDSDGMFLLHDSTVLFYEEWGVKPWVAPDTEFLLIMSKRYTLYEDELHISISSPFTKDQDVVFLISRRANGEEFPTSADVSQGRLDRRATIRMRTKCLVQAIATSGTSRALPDLVLTALAAASTYKYKMSHQGSAVVAVEQPKSKPGNRATYKDAALPSTGVSSWHINALLLVTMATAVALVASILYRPTDHTAPGLPLPPEYIPARGRKGAKHKKKN